jgi:hypothetical protein
MPLNTYRKTIIRIWVGRKWEANFWGLPARAPFFALNMGKYGDVLNNFQKEKRGFERQKRIVGRKNTTGPSWRD